jgi:hypothetical protein
MHYLYIILVRTCKIERIKVKNHTHTHRIVFARGTTIKSKISAHVNGAGNGSAAGAVFSLVASGIFFDKKQTLKQTIFFLK